MLKGWRLTQGTQECQELQARMPSSAVREPLPEIHAMERQHEEFLQELHAIPPLAAPAEVGRQLKFN